MVESYAKHFLSNILATLATITLAYILYTFLPKTVLIENGVGFESISDFVVHLLGAFLANIISYVVFYSIHANTALQNSKLENEILEQAHLRAQLLSLQGSSFSLMPATSFIPSVKLASSLPSLANLINTSHSLFVALPSVNRSTSNLLYLSSSIILVYNGRGDSHKQVGYGN